VIENDWHDLINSPMFQDAEWHLHTIVTFCALGYAHARHAHVRLDLFRPCFKPRTKLWIEWLGGVMLFMPFMAIFCFYAYMYFDLAWFSNERAGTLTASITAGSSSFSYSLGRYRCSWRALRA
jgi:TRAP-type mannitol/chloroaromatic compound transport system permease small subunit